ncbi:MAG: UTP--glucose-1-phosphate uridylyltransferase [Nitrospinaceae bacterium]
MTAKITRDQLLALGLDKPAAAGFLRLLQGYRTGSTKIQEWESLASPDPFHLPAYETLPDPAPDWLAAGFSRLVVLKLNGGLGTGMGCSAPKSSIPVKGGQSFMDLILRQMKDLQAYAPVPLMLMNSFYTDAATQEMLAGARDGIPLETFTQNRFPRLFRDTGEPLSPEQWGHAAWYPPGHGDLYACLQDQGWLDRWLGEGREVLFVSNADNLGSLVDARILHFILENDIPFLMEMTPKTPADVKGGTLFQKDGRLHLLEMASVPEEHLAEFQGMDKFRVFNTNNIWIHLRHLKSRLQTGPLNLTVIVNGKQVDGNPVVQLETAVGAGLENFAQAVGLVVARDRFAPVKTTNDLLLIQSDLFNEDSGRLLRHPGRVNPALPQVHLGETFKNLDDFNARIPQPLRLLELESLTVEGDVRFQGGATLKGNVRLKGLQAPLVIPADSIVEDETRET